MLIPVTTILLKCDVCGREFHPRNMIRHKIACLKRKRRARDKNRDPRYPKSI